MTREPNFLQVIQMKQRNTLSPHFLFDILIFPLTCLEVVSLKFDNIFRLKCGILTYVSEYRILKN